MRKLLTQPYIYNSEYLEENQEAKFFEKPNIEWFYPINQDIWEYYQVKEVNEAFNIYFGNLSNLRKRYILLAIKEIDQIISERIKNGTRA